jgi:osmoprotectant transport system ATP-binding protein
VFELAGVEKEYGAVGAVRGVDLVIAAGTTTVLIGPSGCGKSTLLKLLLALVRPDRGELRVDGAVVAPERVVALRRRIGYVVQDGGLFPHLSARDNVTLMACHLGWAAAQQQARLGELSALVQLPADALDRYPIQLSGGQRQRVALMRALMLDPEVLLLDEPLGALDPLIRSELQADLRVIFERLKKTVVLVTHDLGEAAFFGGTVVLMRQGRIVQKGALTDLIHRPADPFVTRFVRAQRSPLEAVT